MITPLTTLFYAISSARGSAAHPRLVLRVVRCGEQHVTVRQNSHSGERISKGGGRGGGGDVMFNNNNNSKVQIQSYLAACAFPSEDCPCTEVQLPL